MLHFVQCVSQPTFLQSLSESQQFMIPGNLTSTYHGKCCTVQGHSKVAVARISLQKHADAIYKDFLAVKEMKISVEKF